MMPEEHSKPYQRSKICQKAVSYFCKTLYLKCLTGFWMRFWMLKSIFSSFFNISKLCIHHTASFFFFAKPVNMWYHHQAALKPCGILHARSSRNTSILHLPQKLFHTTTWILLPPPDNTYSYVLWLSLWWPLHTKFCKCIICSALSKFNSAPSEIMIIQYPTHIPT